MRLLSELAGGLMLSTILRMGFEQRCEKSDAWMRQRFCCWKVASESAVRLAMFYLFLLSAFPKRSTACFSGVGELENELDQNSYARFAPCVLTSSSFLGVKRTSHARRERIILMLRRRQLVHTLS